MRNLLFLTVMVLLLGGIALPASGQGDPKKPKAGSASRKIQDEDPKKSPNENPKKKQDKSKGKQEDSSKQKEGDKNQGDNNQGSSNASANQQQQAASDALAAYLNSARRARLGRTPRMFGDWFRPGVSVLNSSEAPNGAILTDVSIPNATRVGKISENNSALPFDRFFLNYSYFHNAIRGGASIASFGHFESPSVERYTVGLEKTFLDGMTSIEARFVMANNPDFAHNPLGPGANGYQSHSPTFGNLSLVGKVLLLENESTVLAAGLGLELPTGGDTFIKSGSTILEFENQTVYLSPYIGLLKSPTDSPWFLSAFVQLEAPLNGDDVRGIDPITASTFSGGRLTSETTLFVDLALGRWLYQNTNATVSGIAMFTEAHFNAALNDSDLTSTTFTSNGFNGGFITNLNEDRFDIVDLTAGIHIEIANQTKLRIGAVFPVGHEKAFDGELGIQLTRNR